MSNKLSFLAVLFCITTATFAADRPQEQEAASINLNLQLQEQSDTDSDSELKRPHSFQELIEGIKRQVNDWKELCVEALAEVKDAPEVLEIVSQSHEIERADLTQLIEQIAGQCFLDETQKEELENLRQLLKK